MPALRGEATQAVVGEINHLLSANRGILERKPANENTVRAKHAHTTEGTARPSLLFRRAGMHARSTEGLSMVDDMRVDSRKRLCGEFASMMLFFNTTS
jgi:hypothetical protein